MIKEFMVLDMSCGHCAQVITNEVSSVAGVQNVSVDLGTKRVSVETNTEVSSDRIVDAINEAGYVDITVLN